MIAKMCLIPISVLRQVPPVRCPACGLELRPVLDESGMPVDFVESRSVAWIERPSPATAGDGGMEARKDVLLYGEAHGCRPAKARPVARR